PARFTQRSFIGLCMEKLPLIVLCVFFMGLAWFFKSQTGNIVSSDIFPLDVRIANAIDAYAIYARQMVWPNDLQFFYPHDHLLNNGKGIPFSHWGVSLVIVLAISVLAVWQIRKRPYLFVGWCWFLGVLVPAIGLVQIALYARADRYMYIPMLGLTIVFVQLLEEMLSRLPARRTLAAVSGLLVIAGLTVVAIPQAESWRNSLALCQHALSIDENNYTAMINLGSYLRKRDAANDEERRRNAEISLHYLEKAKAIMPGYGPVYNNLGLTLLVLNREEQALEAFRKNQEIDSTFVFPYDHIANMYFRKGNYEKVIESLQELVKRQEVSADPDREHSWSKMAYCYRRMKNESKALEFDRKVYALNPKRLDALERIAWSLATYDDETIRDSRQALELADQLNQLSGEKSPVALDTLAAAYAEAGNFDQAIETATKARDLARQLKNEKLLHDIEERHQLYQAGKPYRQSGTPTES
ncbi:MAG: hypothetical protein O2955_20775, partial [Planctomycetota bacterium]|nr:hypothetical protein [Planctomycetota bacterium]